MLPELFNIGPIPIRGYGLMLAITFLFGLLYVRRATKRDGKEFEPYLTIAYIMIFGGVIGARLFYILIHLDEFSGNWLSAVNPFAGNQFGIAGLNLYGGIILAIFGTIAYCRWKNMSVLEVFDYFAPTLAIGLGLTRIGCFLNGCCYGTPTELPWGISFPVGSIPYSIFQDQHLHPAQLYSSLYGFLLFLLLHFMMTRKKFTGQLVAVLFMIEALFRFAIESVRYYEAAMYISIGPWQPTYNHIVSISLFIAGALIYLIQMRRNQSETI